MSNSTPDTFSQDENDTQSNSTNETEENQNYEDFMEQFPDDMQYKEYISYSHFLMEFLDTPIN